MADLITKFDARKSITNDAVLAGVGKPPCGKGPPPLKFHAASYVEFAFRLLAAAYTLAVVAVLIVIVLLRPTPRLARRQFQPLGAKPAPAAIKHLDLRHTNLKGRRLSTLDTLCSL
jgi:hypothetical protein